MLESGRKTVKSTPLEKKRESALSMNSEGALMISELNFVSLVRHMKLRPDEMSLFSWTFLFDLRAP